jgi:excisionase family DNA binding protein
MRFAYEIIVERDGDIYSMDVPDLPGCFTWGDTVEEVLRKAPDALETHVGSLLADGDEVPPAAFDHTVGEGDVLAVVSFEATTASVDAPSVMASTAAERLGVSKGRISQLIKDGRLDGSRNGREVMVTVASIERIERNRRKAGRPRKLATA